MSFGEAHRARKRFGQNFLHDADVVARFPATIHSPPNDCRDRTRSSRTYLGLIEREAISRDRDRRVVARDASSFPPKNCADRGDALRYDWSALSSSLRIVGNLRTTLDSAVVSRFALADTSSISTSPQKKRSTASSRARHQDLWRLRDAAFLSLTKLFNVANARHPSPSHVQCGAHAATRSPRAPTLTPTRLPV